MTTLRADLFPERLRQARVSADLTMDEAAKRLGMANKQAWQAYESGRVVPKIDLCERMAEALNVRAEWLAGWDDG